MQTLHNENYHHNCQVARSHFGHPSITLIRASCRSRALIRGTRGHSKSARLLPRGRLETEATYPKGLSLYVQHFQFFYACRRSYFLVLISVCGTYVQLGSAKHFGMKVGVAEILFLSCRCSRLVFVYLFKTRLLYIYCKGSLSAASRTESRSITFPSGFPVYRNLQGNITSHSLHKKCFTREDELLPTTITHRQ